MKRDVVGRGCYAVSPVPSCPNVVSTMVPRILSDSHFYHKTELSVLFFLWVFIYMPASWVKSIANDYFEK
jgi:hypothetical protein